MCGNGAVEAGEQCDDGNTRGGDGCSSKCTAEAATGPISVEPNVLELQRLSGNTDVHPGKATRAAMLRDHVSSAKGVVRLCVDTTGLVIDSMLTERTGYTEYDSRLVEVVREWHYRPYRINGAPATVCSTVEFVYVPR